MTLVINCAGHRKQKYKDSNKGLTFPFEGWSTSGGGEGSVWPMSTSIKSTWVAIFNERGIALSRLTCSISFLEDIAYTYIASQRRQAREVKDPLWQSWLRRSLFRHRISLRVTHMYIVEMKEKTITHFLFMFQFLQSQSHRSRTHPPYCLPNETDMWPVRHGAFLKLDK